ncbi:hypothetical protein FNYG_15229 [Fusarium nygamai]|uniref:FAD/NAD(P)-binding domain-containing protein n=1 Tax=Gibberella nygamai TaxID=42673 RepID=A0A2K0UHR8_GIBNY|nr:hypothetical protein FNYG_15229 [Fusarium nygamai]
MTTATTTTVLTTKFVPTPAFPIEDLPGSLPHSVVPQGTDADAVLSSVIEGLSSLQGEYLLADAFWRDFLAFTGIFRTFYTSKTIAAAWQELCSCIQPSSFKLDGGARVMQLGSTGWIEGRFLFDIGGALPGKGSGLLITVYSEGAWKIWALSTILESVNRFGNPDVAPSLLKYTSSGSADCNGNGIDQGIPEKADVLIVGAGQNGICIGVRLKALGVESVLIEAEDAVGGNWTSRYDSAKLHTGKYFSHLPFENTFAGDEWPYFLRGKDLAKGYRDYVKRYQLDVRTSTTVEQAKWLENSASWMVKISCRGKHSAIEAKHVVFAIGAGGQHPKMPYIPNREAFKGISLHSKEYRNAKQWKGKRGVVVGTANTGHDVAIDMVEADLTSVTMVQRNPTMVVPWAWFGEAHNRLYHSKAITSESDRRELSLPVSFYHKTSMAAVRKLSAAQPEKFDALERAGFRVERYPDAWKVQFERQGGAYLDVGGSQLIIDGKIKMKSGAIARFIPDGLEFHDGSKLEADVIVWSTGFENDMRTIISDIVGKEMEEKIEHHWYLDKEGEIRGAFKPVGQPRLWYTAGGFAIARFYSRFLALQIKADLEGVPFKPYLKTPGSEC